MKKIIMMLAALLTLSLSACSQGNKAKENKDLKAAYPDVKWKEGKLLNRATKKDLEDWVKR